MIQCGPFPTGNPRASPEATVENPELVAAFADHAAQNSERTWQKLLLELGHANYLVALLDDKTDFNIADRQGSAVIEKGSRLAVLFCKNEDDESFVTLFTDAGEIEAWTNQRVSTLVMPAEQAWQFVLSQPMYDGLVINPAGLAFEINRAQIELLQQAHQGASDGCGATDAAREFDVQNERIVDLLDRVQSNPELRGEIYGALAGSQLIIGSRQPLQLASAGNELDEDTEVTLLTTVSPDGGPALPVFTDTAALHARNREAYPIGMAAEDLFSLVIEDGYEGIVLNPASNWIFIPREDLSGLVAHA